MSTENAIVRVTFSLDIPGNEVAWMAADCAPEDWAGREDAIARAVANWMPDALERFANGEPEIEVST